MIELTNDNFESFVKKDGVVIVDFWAPWCGPCKAVKKILQELDTVTSIGLYDVSQKESIHELFEILSVPTALFFYNGELAEKLTGSVSKEKMLEIILKLEHGESL